MVSLNDLKELTLYKKQFYLPINTKDKKHGSVITLLTPNFNSSKMAMTAPYMINHRYFESYYVEKEITRLIKNESVFEMEDQGEYIFEEALDAGERNELSDSEFGIPELRKYPLNDEKHVLLAIRFFNYVESKYEKELAGNIISKIEEYDMASQINVTDANRFAKYWNKVKDSFIDESAILLESTSRKDVIDTVTDALKNEGIEPHFTKAEYNEFINDENSSLCLGSFNKDTWGKAYTITTKSIPTGYKASKDNYFTVYIEDKNPTAKDEAVYKRDLINVDAVKNTDEKLAKLNSRSNIYFNGYRAGIKAVKKFLDKDSVKRCFDRMGKPNVSKVILYICDDHTVPPYFTNGMVLIYTQNALKRAGIHMHYSDYIKYILQLYAVYSLAPNAMASRIYDSIAEPAAIYFSGIAKDKISDNDAKYLGVEKTFKYIEEKYSLETLMNIITSNNVKDLMKYNHEMLTAGEDNADFMAWYKAMMSEKENSLKFIKEAEGEETSSSDETISAENPIPGSIKRIQNMATRLKRSIRRQSIYKLNKIRRDMERGNVGTEHHEIKSLELLKAGLPNIEPKVETESFSIKDFDKYTNGDYITEGGVVYLFEDDNKYDVALRQSLFKDRFRNNKQVLQLYSRVKAELPFIKYAFVKRSRYQGRNLFVDLSYYNEAFFRNTAYLNDEDRKNPVRIFRIYSELLERLLKDDDTTMYTTKTIFIPVLDWNHNNSMRMWMYRDDINPISVIYDMMLHNPNSLKKIFGNRDVVFLGGKNYFRVNFANTDFSNRTNATKFLALIKRIIKLGYTSPADPDPEGELDISPKGIALDIINKVEKSQNVDITDVSKIDTLSKSADIYVGTNTTPPIDSHIPAVKKDAVDIPSSKIPAATTKVYSGKAIKTDFTKSRPSHEKVPVEVDKKVVTPAENQASIGSTDTKAVNTTSEDDKKNAIVDRIVSAADNSDSIASAMSKLNDAEFKEMISDLQNDSVENVRVSRTQASAVVKTQDEFHKREIDGRSVQDMLDSDTAEKDIPVSDLPIASINDDWHNMTFVNFDKDYDFNADIMKMLDGMKNWTYPIAVTNVDIKDNSTSEDILDLWTIDCVDYRGKKFTLRIDIPKFINGSNFLKLRGNEKTLMIQSALLPIIKTNLAECQIIGSGGYNKIFVRKFGDRKGQSMASANRLMRALNKYCANHDDIVIETGDNTKICAKYELPIDYIDLSRSINSITMDQLKIYFNQDELRSEYEVDDTKGIPIGIEKVYDEKTKSGIESILYYNGGTGSVSISAYISSLLTRSPSFSECYVRIPNTASKSTYSKASILNCEIPVVLVCAYLEGLVSTMNKGGVHYRFVQELDKFDKYNDTIDYIRFSDGYLVYDVNYSSSLLMNGLKENDTESYSIKDINNRKMYLDFLDSFAGNLDADGLENSYDCMIDPITKEILERFKMPSDYVSVLIYASNLLADNKYVKHTDQGGRRWRRKELIAGYFYKALTTAYQKYANANRRTRKNNRLDIKQSAVIDLLVSTDPATSDLSVNNALNDVECANTVTNKGLVGMNVARGYTIATRGYDDSMLNLLGMDTGFSGNVGINRQATVNANIEGGRGFVKTIDGNTDKLSAASAFTMTEAVTPFGSTHDDPPRTLMTYVQTSKHMIRCDHNDPTLVTTGADEAMPYMVSDIFAYKAKRDGKIVEMEQEGFGGKNYMVLEYSDGKHEFVNLSEEVKKNSDGGYYVPMKLDTDLHIGDTFKAGNILAYDKLSFSKSLGESGNLAANIGTLAKVAIINTDEGFEDSAAITESFAEKLGTQVIQSVETRLNKGSNIYVHKKIGDSVMEGDILFEYQEDFDDDVVNTLLKNLAIDNEGINKLGRKPVMSKYTGIVSDIAVYRTCADGDMSPSLGGFVSEYENRVEELRDVYGKYGIDDAALPQTGRVPAVGRTKNLDDAVLVVYYIKYTDTMGVGDKIVFYSANKGIVRGVIPKDEEPYTEFRPNEKLASFMSLSSISGRMTCSIPLFAATSKLMVELDRSIKDLAGIPYDESNL